MILSKPNRVLMLACGLIVGCAMLLHAQQPDATTPAPTTKPAHIDATATPGTDAVDQPEATTSQAPAATTPTGKGTGPAYRTTSGATKWVEKLFGGGGVGPYVIGVQLLMSMIAGGYAVGCMLTIRRSRIVPAGLAAQATAMWRDGKIKELEELGQRNPSVLARVISFMVIHRDNNLTDLGTTSGDLAASELGDLSQRATPIAVVANLEPLMGLLGTVFGMIECFDVVAAVGEMGDPSMLAGGISTALMTTAVGLVLAIPLLYIHHHFDSAATRYGTELEKQVTLLTAEWFMSGKKRGQ